MANMFEVGDLITYDGDFVNLVIENDLEKECIKFITLYSKTYPSFNGKISVLGYNEIYYLQSIGWYKI